MEEKDKKEINEALDEIFNEEDKSFINNEDNNLDGIIFEGLNNTNLSSSVDNAELVEDIQSENEPVNTSIPLDNLENNSNNLNDEVSFEELNSNLLSNASDNEIVEDIQSENEPVNAEIPLDNLENNSNNLNDQILFNNNISNNEVGNSVEDNSLNNLKKKDKIYLDYNARLLINIGCIVLCFILSLSFLFLSISINKKSDVTYKQTSNLDYKVFLKENEYYKEPYLNKNMQYIASLIDNIDVKFDYNFNVDKEIDYRYTYYINSEIRVTDPNDKSKVIYSKVDKLTEPSLVSKEKSLGFSILEQVKIDYAKYNKLVNDFKNSYVLNADSNLILSLCVDIEDSKGNKIKNVDSDNMNLIIPLTEKVININMDYKEVNNINNVKVYKEFSISNVFTFVLAIILLIGMLLFILNLIRFIRKTTVKKTEYDIMLSKILREYDRLIVNTKKDIEVTGEIIDVNDFNELLDVRDNLEKPILFREIHKGQKSVFIVKNNKENYRYILKLADLQNNK